MWHVLVSAAFWPWRNSSAACSPDVESAVRVPVRRSPTANAASMHASACWQRPDVAVGARTCRRCLPTGFFCGLSSSSPVRHSCCDCVCMQQARASTRARCSSRLEHHPPPRPRRRHRAANLSACTPLLRRARTSGAELVFLEVDPLGGVFWLIMVATAVTSVVSYAKLHNGASHAHPLVTRAPRCTRTAHPLHTHC